jgi:hypothetical protein
MSLHVNPTHATYTPGQTVINTTVGIGLAFLPGDPEFNQLLAAMGPWDYYVSPQKSLNGVANIDITFIGADGELKGTTNLQKQNPEYSFYGWYSNPESVTIQLGGAVNIPTDVGYGGTAQVDVTLTGDISASASGAGPIYLQSSSNGEPPPGEYTLTLSVSPQTVQYGDTMTIQAALTQNGSPVIGKEVWVYYKNLTDADFTHLKSIGPTDNSGLASYTQTVDPSWFKDETCYLLALVYQEAESNLITLTLTEEQPPPPPPTDNLLIPALLAVGVVAIIGLSWWKKK